MSDHNVVDVWFELRDAMLSKGESPTGARPPSLRDACYAHTLAMRSTNDCDASTIEAFVNGLEIGAMSALRDAWNRRTSG